MFFRVNSSLESNSLSFTTSKLKGYEFCDPLSFRRYIDSEVKKCCFTLRWNQRMDGLLPNAKHFRVVFPKEKMSKKP